MPVPILGKTRSFAEEDRELVSSLGTLDSGDVVKAAFDNAALNGLGVSGALWVNRMFNNATEESITAEEANKRYGIPGRLNFSEPISDIAAAQLRVRHNDDIASEQITSRGRGGFLETVGIFGGGLLGSMRDPAEFILNFVPITWGVKSAQAGKLLSNAEMAARFTGKTIGKRALMRAGEGAVEGSVGGAISGAAMWGLMSQEEKDYSANDFVRDVAFGSIMGATVQVPIGAISDAFARRGGRVRVKDLLPASVQTDALKLVNSGVYDFDQMLGMLPRVVEEEMKLGRALSQEERLLILARENQPVKQAATTTATQYKPASSVEMALSEAQYSKHPSYTDDILKLASKQDVSDLNKNFIVVSDENGRPYLQQSPDTGEAKRPQGVKVKNGVSFLLDDTTNTASFKSDENIARMLAVAANAKRAFRGETEVLLRKPSEDVQSSAFLDTDGVIYRKDMTASGKVYFEKIGDTTTDNLQKTMKDHGLSSIEKNAVDKKQSKFYRPSKKEVQQEQVKRLTQALTTEKPAPVEVSAKPEKTDEVSISDAKSLDEQIAALKKEIPADKGDAKVESPEIKAANEKLSDLKSRAKGFQKAINCLLGAM